MNDRIFEINNLLQEFVRLDKNYGYLTEDQIYTYLTYDKTDKNNDYELNDVWNTLIKELDTKKSNSTLNRGLEGWLTIRSKNYCDYRKSIKLYVNLPYDKIKNDSLKIFKFLDKKKINHVSKISNNVRNDSLVIRVNDAEDARTIIEFINKKIKKDARKTNPFTFREGMVGIGYDGNSSYNHFISFVISEYIKSRKDNANLDSVSFGDFNSYVLELYKYYFEQKHINELKNTFNFSDELKRLQESSFRFDEKELLLNYENMFKVLIASLHETNKVNDIIGYIIDLQDNKYAQNRMDKYSSEMSEVNNKEIPTIRKNDTEYVDLLRKYTEYAISRYGYMQAYNQLNAFMYNDSIDKYRYITSQNNFRNLFKECDMANKIHGIFKDLNEFMRTCVKTDLEQLTMIINSYIDKFGVASKHSLKMLKLNRNYEFIDEKYRDIFMGVDMANNIKYIISDSVDEYVDTYLQNQKVAIYHPE